jgi:hypothetical protein
LNVLEDIVNDPAIDLIAGNNEDNEEDEQDITSGTVQEDDLDSDARERRMADALDALQEAVLRSDRATIENDMEALICEELGPVPKDVLNAMKQIYVTAKHESCKAFLHSLMNAFLEWDPEQYIDWSLSIGVLKAVFRLQKKYRMDVQKRENL